MGSMKQHVCRGNWSRCSKRWTTIGIREAHTPASGVRRVDDPSTAAVAWKNTETSFVAAACRTLIRTGRGVSVPWRVVPSSSSYHTLGLYCIHSFARMDDRDCTVSPVLEQGALRLAGISNSSITTKGVSRRSCPTYMLDVSMPRQRVDPNTCEDHGHVSKTPRTRSLLRLFDNLFSGKRSEQMLPRVFWQCTGSLQLLTS
jgi:hypothetical protein